MRPFLDTHVFLWAVAGSPRLTASTRRVMSGASTVYVSAVSIWKVAIKASLGKIDADAAMLAAAIEPSGFAKLPITVAHAAGVGGLPPLHADPIDRLLIAQAMAEPLRLLKADGLLAGYSELVVVL